MSTGSIVRWVSNAARTLEPVETRIKAALKAAPVKHKDETGACALGDNGKHHWFHVTSTQEWTHVFFHRKRGQEAVEAEGIMPGESNISVHDGHQTSFPFEQCQHALCGVHLLRALVGVFERTGLPWTQAMIWILHEGRRLAELAREAGQTQDESEVQRAVRWLSLHLLRAARDVTPVFAAGPKPRRGRAKHSEAWLFLHRLQKYRHAVLLFLSDLRVPFDNNLAERDLRMITLQQKMSGTFRSPQGAVDFARLRGYLSTLRKQGLDLFEGLSQTMLGSPLLPTF